MSTQSWKSKFDQKYLKYRGVRIFSQIAEIQRKRFGNPLTFLYYFYGIGFQISPRAWNEFQMEWLAFKWAPYQLSELWPTKILLCNDLLLQSANTVWPLYNKYEYYLNLLSSICKNMKIYIGTKQIKENNDMLKMKYLM